MNMSFIWPPYMRTPLPILPHAGDGRVLQHPLCQGAVCRSEPAGSSGGGRRQVLPGGLLHHGELLLPQGATIDNYHSRALISSCSSRPRLMIVFPLIHILDLLKVQQILTRLVVNPELPGPY